jgi:molecular chaperone DnaJ
LSDDEKRALYDQVGDEHFADALQGQGHGQGPMGPGGFPMDDLFAQMFANFGGFHGPPRHHSRRNDDVHIINITLDQAYVGVTKTIRINVRKPCFNCAQECDACQGRGSITDMQRMGIFTTTSTRPCHVCKGAGKKRGSTECSSCKGAGHTAQDQTHEIMIPPGVQPGYQVRLQGLGEQAQGPGDIPGDMIIKINIEGHKVFLRNDQDLVFRDTVTLVESIVGKTFHVPHFEGDILVDTATFGIIVPGKVYVIKGKGMKGGNLNIIFDVKYPTQIIKPEIRAGIREVLTDAFKD